MSATSAQSDSVPYPHPGSRPESFLPAGFLLAVHVGPDEESAPWSGEEDLVGPEWAVNRHQSLLARDCARRAMEALGKSPAPIPRLPYGGPSWPPGITGSMTHCPGYRAAMVGLSERTRSAGLDVEPHKALPPGVLDLIAGPAEQRMVARLQRDVPGVHWDTALFCAKEAVYKAWFPLTRTWLPMKQATAWLKADGSFSINIHIRPNQPADLSLQRWTGHWMLDGEFLLASVVREALA